MGTVTISVEKFEKLVRDSESLRILSAALECAEEMIEKDVRIHVFEEFVKNEELPIERETCGKLLGFEVV